MDEVYHARLSATPHPPAPPPPILADPPPVHIQPFPHPNPSNPNPNPIPIHLPIHLPNIYVNPYPAPPPNAPLQPVNVPSQSQLQTPRGISTNMRFGPFSFSRPHPLLWISLIISLTALVLGVPKGALPTLTGRHKALRAQEKLVNEKLHLLSHLSHFLPPPLAHLVHPDPYLIGYNRAMTDINKRSLQFWNTYARDHGERWWAVEELGEGASLVRSRGEGGEKEVWVLRMGDTGEPNRPLLSALTHSLLLRDKLQQDLDKARSASTAISTISPASALPVGPASTHLSLDRSRSSHELDVREESIKDEWDRLEDRRKREKERERAVEEREREVSRREKWVVDEMRQMSEKIRSQATELTLEDRITERLKSYQRQLAHLHNQPAHQGGGSDTAEN